ncbi:ASCH domain-containing protein [Candidatus Woesearchaeota archaeon]|nr:ASCH domain-containing protein [Candidatus Woesearchaeota archaeon]
MEHLAILDKKRKLLPKILSGEKTIESRWYKHKKTPYGNIKAGDIVYFKDSGEPVTAKATVDKVLFFSDITREKYKEILGNYADAICLEDRNIDHYTNYKYITLIFLKEVNKIKAFQVNKKGYGMMAAWITMDNINKIKKHL